MARRSSTRHDSVVGREVFNIASRRLPLTRKSVMRQYEDRREFHPDGRHQSPRSINKFHTEFQVRRAPRARVEPVDFTQNSFQAVPWNISFVKPREVLTCVRRKIRREVLHAFRVAGKRGLSGPRYNEFSKVSC